MSDPGDTSAPVVQVAAGLEMTDDRTPIGNSRHEALEVLIGKWINQGKTVAAGLPPVPCRDQGGLLRWIGGRTRCTATNGDDGTK